MSTMLKLMRAFLVLAALWIPAAMAAGQGVSSLTELRKVTDGAMAKVGAGDLESGLKDIRPLTVIPSAEFDALLGQVPGQLPGMLARFGASLGHEFISEERLGESMARIVYIHRFEKHAMRWMFFAYKGRSGWVINTFRFDDRWHEMFVPL